MVKFDLNNRFKFYCEIFEEGGVVIHDKIHFFFGEQNEEWSEGYDMLFIMKVTYNDKTGWYYSNTDSCPGCHPKCFFNGCVSELNDIEEDKMDGMELWNKCINEGIPKNVVNRFMKYHFKSEEVYYCDRCYEDIKENYYYRCDECTNNFRKQYEYELCEKCAMERHSPFIGYKKFKLDDKHKIREKKASKYSCDGCGDIEKYKMNCYTCDRCNERTRKNHIMTFCEECYREDDPVELTDEKVKTGIIHEKSHEIRKETMLELYNIIDDEMIINKTRDFFYELPELQIFFEKHMDVNKYI